MLRLHVGTRRYFSQGPSTASFKAGMNEIGPAGIGRRSELAVLPDHAARCRLHYGERMRAS